MSSACSAAAAALSVWPSSCRQGFGLHGLPGALGQGRARPALRLLLLWEQRNESCPVVSVAFLKEGRNAPALIPVLAKTA